jgi:hypothetical protein
MGYIKNKPINSRLTSVHKELDAITLEQKIEAIVSNKEPINDGAPEIFTERKDGVVSAYNIRTDRWEIAAEAMNIVEANLAAKREAAQLQKDGKVVDMNTGKEIKPDNPKDGGVGEA